MPIKFHQWIPWISLSALLALTWMAYHPGLYGDFLFDDFANLPALGSTGPVTHWATFFRYITSGKADPTGRPLTLLSFLIDGHDWPTAAYPFKRTNVLLHLVNGTLLATLLVGLGKRHFLPETPQTLVRIRMAAVTAAGLWLIHPLFVSTVLYVVQREAMLPMTFELIGLLLWLHGRDLMVQGRRAAGTTWIILGLVACTGLATLSKANGVLLPLYAVLTEYLLLRKSPSICSSTSSFPSKPSPSYRRLFLLVAWLPSAILLTYLAYLGIVGAIHGVGRPWSIWQRLMTEPRVLFDYLDLLWLPRPFTPGLFNDQIVASHSLWAPLTTSLALLGVGVLIIAGWKIRRRHPVLAFAILFYFAGQLLESTTVALELYYEHRNYIPAMPMFWPLSLWLWDAGHDRPRGYERLKIALITVLLLGLGAMTRVRAELWGNGHQQALLWATLNPASPRAQANAADYEMSAGHPRQAAARLVKALRVHSHDPQISLNILSAHCQMGGLTAGDLELANDTFAHMDAKGAQVLFHWLGNAIHLASTQGCPGLTLDSISNMLNAAASNPSLNHITGRMQDIHHLRGLLALDKQQPDLALAWFEKGLALHPSPQVAFEQAALLGSSGHPREGLAELDFYENQPQAPILGGLNMAHLHAWVLQKQGYWPKELAYLRNTLHQDAEAKIQDKK